MHTERVEISTDKTKRISQQEEKNLQKTAPHQRGDMPIAVPEPTVLDVNYRTHNGILKMAAGVIDLLQDSFPGSFDHLPRERGYFDGPLPVWLLETSVEEAAVMIVGSDKKASQIE
jgi:hypothetical protein